MKKKYKNPISTGICLGSVFIIAVLTILTALNINSHQIMTVAGALGVLFFLCSLKNFVRQEIEMKNLKEIESLILTTIGGNLGYLITMILALILFSQEAIVNNYALVIGMSLCFIAIVMLELRLVEIRDEAMEKIIKQIEG